MMMKQLTKQPLAWWKTVVYAGLAGLILLGGGQAMAQTWYGTVSTAWNNPTNWTPSWDIPNSIQSVPGASAGIIVPAGCSFYPMITSSVSIGSLTLNQGSGSVTVAGGTLAVTSGGISVLSGSSFTINAGASVTSTAGVTAGGTWVVNGTLTAAVTMYNTVSFTINSGGTVNASTGGLNANDNGGYLYIYGTLNDGANAISDNANIIVSGGSLTAGNLTLNAGGLTVTSGTLNAGGFTFYNGGNLTISGSSTVTSSGTWAYDGGGYSLTGGNYSFSGANVTLPNGTFASLNLSGTGTDVLASGTTISGNLSLASGTKASVASGLNISAGSLTLAGTGQVNGTWGSTTSTAANKNSTYFSGAGLVTVTTNAALQNTTTSLSALSPATYGNSVTFTATVAPAPGGGTVQFSTNGVAFGSAVTVSGGTATLATSALLPGSYAITAAFNGTATYSSSAAAAVTQVVNKAAVTITSGVTANSKAYDGTTTTTISSLNVVLSGVVAGNAANVVLGTSGYTATFASAGAGSSVGVTVSGLTLTGSAAANYTLTQPAGLTANITALPVTITAGLAAGNKVYNGSATATLSVNSVQLSGVLATDAAKVSLATSGYTATFASSAVGNGLNVTVGGLTLTGTAAANYTLSQPTGLTANITAIPITIAAGISANNKAYDGTTTATINSNNVVFSGVLTVDAANVKLSTNGYTAAFASGAAGNGLSVTVNGLTLTGSAAANYTLTQPAGLTANITGLPATIASGLTANNKAYDGTTTATLSANNPGLSGVLAADTAKVSLSTSGYTATFASAGAGTSLAVTVSGLTLTGSAAANYTLTQPAGLTASISALPVIIASGLTAKSKIYDGTTTAAINVSGVILSGVLAGDTTKVALSTNGYLATFASSAVGTGVGVSVSGLALTGTAAANYTLTQPAGLTANITSTALTVASGITANGKVYDGSTSATINLNNAGLSGVLAVDAANVKLSSNGYTATFSTAMAGAGLGVTVSGLTLTGAAAANYTLTQPAGLTASITPAPVTIASGITANNKAYDANTTAAVSVNNVALSGVLAADTAKVSLSTSGYTATFASSAAGTGLSVTVSGLSLTGTAAANYTLTQPAGLTANITSVPVTVLSGLTANGKVYDTTTTTTISSNNVVLGGVLAADAANVKLSMNGYSATFASATVGTGLGVTVSGLTLTGAAAANYTVAQPAGLTARITPAPVTIASGITASNKSYNGTPSAAISVNNLALSGVLAADTAKVSLSTSGYSATFASASVGTGVAVTVSGLTLTGSAAANYALTQPAGLTANITAAPVVIASGVTALGKVYDGAITAAISVNNVTLGGVVAADSAKVSLSTNGYVATFASANPATGLTVIVSGLTLAGSAAANYALSQPAGLTASIAAAPVTIASGLTVSNKAYDGNVAATISVNNVVLNGVVSADAASVTLATNGYTATFASAAPGLGLNVTISGLTLTGSAATNYKFTQPAGLKANITQTTVAVSTPANGQTIAGNSNTLMVSGTTAGNIPVTGVELNVNGGNWINATSANGWTNWSAALPAPAGADTVLVYAVDTAGNHSVTNTLTFTIIHTSVLTLTTTGSGLAGPPYNGQSLEVGQSYTVVATPQYGWMFTNWTSNLLPVSTLASLNFTMASNLVLTANFVYTNYPVLAFTTPTNGEAWVTNAAQVKVAGTASGTVPLSNVWLSLNGGAWTNAVTANQWKNWSRVLPVAAGSQVLSAYAVDTAGYHSLTNTVDFTLIHTSLMTVRTNGNGTVSTNFDNLRLEVGVNYVMQATGRHGWTFLSWTSNLLPANINILTNNPYITFTMQSNLVLTANFVDLAPPTLTLNELAKGQTAVTNEAPLTITGTTTPAADASPITNVWVSFNSNAWQSATSTAASTSTNQWSSWMAVMTPTPGLQSVRAYAVDAIGNASLTNAFTFTCRQSFALVVRTNQTGTGLGTINPNYNGRQLIAGNTLTMKAQPLPGNAFVSWTSNVLPPTNAQTITFTMVSNLVLYANFRDTTPPTLTVTSPANGRVVTASPITLQGNASDDIAVAQVWYAVNSNAWQLAAGTTNWTASVTLAPGTNVIQAYALDTANNSSPTKTVTVVFPTAPASLTNLRALVTPEDGTPPFEVDFGAKVFSQYAWSTNNDNDAGNYAYASADQATGLLQLQSSALPENSGTQTWLLEFTNHYAAFLDYTNAAGQPVTASAVFSAITNVTPATLTGQTLVSVNALSAQTTYNFLKNSVVIATTGARQQTNTWTLQNYGPCGALLVLASATQTNWSLFHFETALAAEYISESTDGTADAGLAGFIRTTSGGNAPATAAALNSSVALDNAGATLTTIFLNNGAFALTTSDDSLTGAGLYDYTKLSANVGQFILTYTGAHVGTSITSVIQFYNPNFGIVTNTAGISGLLLH